MVVGPRPGRLGRALLALTLLASACVDRAPADDGPWTYAAVGASDGEGIGARNPRHENWPAVFHRTALPPETKLLNLGIGGATVAQALAEEVPQAVVAEPRLVTVWLTINDLFRRVPVSAYERDLGRLVRRLRRHGETEVLLGNTPPLERLPMVRACLADGATLPGCPLQVRVPTAVVQQAVAAYNDVIARVAEREGAVLVDVHAAGLAAAADGSEFTLVSGDGIHPSTEGYQRLAAVFADALRGSPRTRHLARQP